MRNHRVLFAASTILLGFLGTGSQIDCSEEQKAANAVHAVREQSQTELTLRATPAPDLSDDTIFLETNGEPSGGKQVRLVSFYRVTVAPYKLEGGRVEMGSVVVDSSPEWLVAIDCQQHREYLLSGSKDPTAGFNDLIRSLQLKVTNSGSALSVFDSYLKIARGSEFRSRVLRDDLNLESVAMNDFRTRFSYPKSRIAFTNWWRTIPGSTKHAIEPPSAIATKSGFGIQFFFYDLERLRRQVVDINSDGTASEEKTHALDFQPKNR
jgi:hypothetical protein